MTEYDPTIPAPGAQLERPCRTELRTFTYAPHLADVDDLPGLAARFARPCTTSGLVELQHWLRQGHPHRRSSLQHGLSTISLHTGETAPHD